MYFRENTLLLGTIKSTGDINSQGMSHKSLVRSKETFWPGLKREHFAKPLAAFNLYKDGDSKYCNIFHVMEHHEVIKISGRGSSETKSKYFL